MIITDIRVMRLLGPLAHGVGAKEHMITKLIIRVDTDAGVYGLGEADDFLGTRDAIEYIRACLIGRDPLNIRPLMSEVQNGALPPYSVSNDYYKHRRANCYQIHPDICSPTATPTGPIAWGMSGVEIALCDLVGKVYGTPVYNLLGGKFRDRVKVYLDRSCPVETSNKNAWREMARKVVEDGFTHLKFDAEYIAADYAGDVWNRSIPMRQLDQMVERLTVVRETIGNEIDLCIDCHMQYNTTDAIKLARAMEPLKLTWLEDPTPITNIDAYVAVREESSTPICMGEMLIPEQFRMFIDRRACDIIHPDVLFVGGLHETRRVGEYADLHYMPMALHGNGGILATVAAGHVAATARNFLGLEYHFHGIDWLANYVRRIDQPLFKDGFLPLGDAPGLGIELNREVCERYLAPGEEILER